MSFPVLDGRYIRDARGVESLSATSVLLEHDLATVSGIVAAMAALERRMPGYVRPAVHGAGTLGVSGVTCEISNRGGHDLPAMVLAAACAHSSGTEVVAISARQLVDAVSNMAPAEQCTAFQHPNLAAWRRISTRLQREPSAMALAFFIDRPYRASSNPIIEALLAEPR
jgi:hypothetical protein